MSIASELEDLQTNVAAAQEAVVAKGGTVTGGLADLATNIEEIPSGETIPETQYGAVLLYKTMDGNTPVVEDGTEWVTLQNASAYDALGSTTTDIAINGESKPRAAIKGFAFGTSNTATPENCFLQNCLSLELIDTSFATSLTSIGHSFLSGCQNFNGPIVLNEGLTSIGRNFLQNCRNFNQPVTFPDSITAIDSGAFYSCRALNKRIILPSRLSSLGANCLYGCRVFNQDIFVPGTIGTLEVFMNACQGYVSGTITLGEGLTGTVTTGFGGTFNGLGASASDSGEFSSTLIIPSTFVQHNTNDFSGACIGEVRLVPGITTVPHRFLNGGDSFKKVNLPRTITSFAGAFLSH